MRFFTAVVAIFIFGLGWSCSSPAIWEAKDAWKLCKGYVDRTTPAESRNQASPTCQHLHMCANEYTWDEAGQKKLRAIMAAKGCATP